MIRKNTPAYGNVAVNADTFAELRSISTTAIQDGFAAIVAGGLSRGDGDGSIFIWDGTENSADDDLDTLAPSDGGNGRWKRVGLRGPKGEQGIGLPNLATSGGAQLVGYGAVTVAAKLGQQAFSPNDYGAAGNGVTNDAVAIQAAIDAASAAGGGTVRFNGGKTYRSNTQLILKRNVRLDLNGGKLLAVLAGSGDTANAAAIKVRSNCILENGTIEVQSSGSPSYQAAVHSPILVGSIYSDGGSVAAPNEDDFASGWTIRNLTLTTNKDAFVPADGPVPARGLGGVAIAMSGGPNNGIIENIRIPDSAVMAGGIAADWGFLGFISSGDIAGNRTRFDANTACTVHPNNIVIRNIKIGKLTRARVGQDTGAHAVRLSGCYNFLVENVTAEQTTYASFIHTAGDLGFEFADALVKPMGCRNTVFRDCSVLNCTQGNLVYSDSLGDNVARATTYTPLVDPLYTTNIRFEGISGRGTRTANSVDGIYFIQQRGGVATGCDVSGFRNGLVFEDQTSDGLFQRCRSYGNRLHGVSVEHPTNAPRRCTVENVTAFGNGLDGATAASSANIFVGTSTGTTISGGVLGQSGDTTRFGIFAKNFSDRTVGLSILNNPTIVGHGSGGFAVLVGSDESFGVLRIFTGATYGSAVVNRFGGLSIVPMSIDSSGNAERTTYRSSRQKLSSDTNPPAGFTGKAGDIINFIDPNENSRSICLSSGSPGTWSARP